eukprot:CAMPEP_0178999032 /NCGR_PEP_ID=MMETSP0795-20121207/9830_1 /TAXON_ID=88552 /ORGANISM="Amoebophrya sp., Strain Ameob2" /LENGTH=397 /DNA_ID=CAMNT_0020691751 /DNA_START=286 /DNA_END=1479 /DNA_ORIENTATION=+
MTGQAGEDVPPPQFQHDDELTRSKRAAKANRHAPPKHGHDWDSESPASFGAGVYNPPTPNITPRSEIADEPQPYSKFSLEKQLLVIYGATSRTGQWQVRQALESGIFRVRAYCRSAAKLHEQQIEIGKRGQPPQGTAAYYPPFVKTRAQLPGLDDLLFGAHLEEERPHNCSRRGVTVVDAKTDLEVVEGDITDLEAVKLAMRDAAYVSIVVRPEKGQVEPFVDFVRTVLEMMRRPAGMSVKKLYMQSHADLPEPSEVPDEKKGDPKVKSVPGLKQFEAEALFKTMVMLKREAPDLNWFCSRTYPPVEGPTSWKPTNNVIGFDPAGKKPPNKGVKFSGLSQWSLLLMQNQQLWVRQFPYLGYGTDHMQYYQTGEKALKEMEELPPGATEEEKVKYGAT